MKYLLRQIVSSAKYMPERPCKDISTMMPNGQAVFIKTEKGSDGSWKSRHHGPAAGTASTGGKNCHGKATLHFFLRISEPSLKINENLDPLGADMYHESF
jgi:hypothetical protein